MFNISSVSKQTSSFLTISFVLFIVYLLITNQLNSFIQLMTTSNWSNMPAPNINLPQILQSQPAQAVANTVNSNINTTAQQPGSTQSYSNLFGNVFSGGVLQGLASIGQIGNKFLGNGT